MLKVKKGKEGKEWVILLREIKKRGRMELITIRKSSGKRGI